MNYIELAKLQNYSQVATGEVALEDAIVLLSDKPGSPETTKRLQSAIRMRNLALQSEAQGVVRKADFYWKEMNNEAIALGREHLDKLDEVVSTFEGVTSGPDFLVATTFLAEISAALSMKQGDARRQKLISNVCRSVEKAKLVDMLDGLDVLHFGEHMNAGRFAEAVTVSKKHSADVDWAYRQLRAISAKAASDLSEGEFAHLLKSDIQHAKSALKLLAELRKQHPFLIDIFTLEAEIEAVKAVRLISNGNLNDGVIALHRAQVLNPGSESNSQLYENISAHVRSTKAQIEEFAAEAERRADIMLNSDGQAMLTEARRAASRLDNPGSGELDSLEKARTQATEYTFWRRVSGANSEIPNEQAPKILLNALRTADLKDVSSIEAALSIHEDLAHIEASEVYRRLNETQDKEELPDKHLKDTWTELATIALPGAEARTQGSEPFGAWWRSSQGKFSKRLAALSVLCLGAAGGALAYDSTQRHTKTVMLKEISESITSNDFNAAKLKVKEYQNTRTLFDHLGSYTRSQPAQTERVEKALALRERNRAVTTYNNAIEDGNTEIAIVAAEHFFAHFGPQDSDERMRSMQEAYKEQISIWIASSFDPSSERHLSRLSVFEQRVENWGR